MTTQQHPAQFDWATELLDAEGHVTLSAKEAHEIGARLRSMGEKLKAYEDLDEAASDVQLLRMGYAAARLEIQSLQARINTMAEEHADELMVAHLDGMRAAQQPAPSAAAPTWRCQHCIDRHDGIYGSWAAPCPYHDDDGKPRINAALASATLKALGAQKAVAWARPVFATEAVEPFDKGDLVDVEFYNHPERPEGEGWRPLVFADTDDARAARKQGANHD